MAALDYVHPEVGPERSPFEGRESVERVPEVPEYGDSSGYKSTELAVFRAVHEGEFTEVKSRPYPFERFGEPSDVVRSTNPFYGEASRSYDVNCADCARSVERTWRGSHEEAAGRLAHVDELGRYEPRGELSEMTEEWAGEQFRPAPDGDEFRGALAEGGHGSSAIAHSTWEQDDHQMAGGTLRSLTNLRNSSLGC